MSKHGVAKSASVSTGRPSSGESWLQGLGSRLAVLRKRRRLSQRQLADRAAVDVSTVSRLESGRLNPTITTLVEIANVLEVSVDELADRDPDTFTRSVGASSGERERAMEADRLAALEEEVKRLRSLLDELPVLARKVSLLAAKLAAGQGVRPSRRKKA
ncbi:XRE family transcriptional regulator [bacterium]|nr:MAG: XRE family transcriptional regulator [bacterium]